VATVDSHPTTTPQALGVALLLWFMGLGVRNMIVSGSPVGIDSIGVTLPPALAPAGVASQPKRRKVRSKKTKPPSRKSRGPRR